MLKHKVALITGSTSGIGLAIAQSLAKEDCHIVLNGFCDHMKLQSLISDLSNITRGKVIYQGANLMIGDEISEMFENIRKEFGGVDILVNNAGMQYVAPIDEFPVEKWDNIISLNLTSVFHTIRHSLPNMKEKGWGRIINVASAHGVVASAGKSAYVATKHGLIGLTKAVALEVAAVINPKTNDYMDITSNAICPGWVLTPLVEDQIHKMALEQKISYDQAKLNLLSEKQPSKRFVQPDELGALTVFLCGEKTSQINGASYIMDGGWTIQ